MVMNWKCRNCNLNDSGTCNYYGMEIEDAENVCEVYDTFNPHDDMEDLDEE